MSEPVILKKSKFVGLYAPIFKLLFRNGIKLLPNCSRGAEEFHTLALSNHKH